MTTATVEAPQHGRRGRGRGTRYPAKCSEFARRLYEDGGYTVNEVVAALAKQGIHPARSTVVYWCNADARETHNLRQKRKRYPSLKRRQRETSWWLKYRRTRELREAGLSFNAISKVLKLDFGVVTTDEQIRHLLQRGGPDSARRLFGEVGGRS